MISSLPFAPVASILSLLHQSGLHDYPERIQDLLENILLPDDKVLELQARTGFVAEKLIESGFDYYGIDSAIELPKHEAVHRDSIEVFPSGSSQNIVLSMYDPWQVYVYQHKKYLLSEHPDEGRTIRAIKTFTRNDQLLLIGKSGEMKKSQSFPDRRAFEQARSILFNQQTITESLKVVCYEPKDTANTSFKRYMFPLETILERAECKLLWETKWFYLVATPVKK